MKKKLSQFVLALVVVGSFGLLVLLTLGAGKLGWSVAKEKEAPLAEIPPVPIESREIHLEPVDITDTYSGMVRPWERFALGFEVSGRVTELGTTAEGNPLDDGDRVEAGQMLARMDDRAFRAMLIQAKARCEQAQSEMDRARKIKDGGIGVITDSEFQDKTTQVALAEAQVALAEKNLDDATLVSPVDAVIARRRVNAGESVASGRIVMELAEVDRVLLVIGVPEAFVGHIRSGQKVRVVPLARDRFSHRRPEAEGQVHHVAETADQTTGLFDVEIAVENGQGHWRPGVIALGHVVIDHVQGFRIPMTASVWRGDRMLLFSVDEKDIAHEYVVDDMIEQEADIILTELPPEHRRIVVRGQQRLVEGRDVQEVDVSSSLEFRL